MESVSCFRHLSKDNIFQPYTFMFLIYVTKQNTAQPKKVKIDFTPAIPSDV